MKENHLYYTPTAEGMKKIETLRAKVIELDDLIDALYDSGEAMDSDTHRAVERCKSIAKTKLEESRQRAIEGIVRLHAKPQDFHDKVMGTEPPTEAPDSHYDLKTLEKVDAPTETKAE